VDRLVVPSARVRRHTQKAPHAAHAEPTLPRVCGRPRRAGTRTRTRNAAYPGPVLSHDTGSATSGLPAIAFGERTRWPVAS